MLQAFGKWKDQIKAELSWADLMLKAAAGDEEAHKELLKKERQKDRRGKRISYW